MLPRRPAPKPRDAIEPLGLVIPASARRSCAEVGDQKIDEILACWYPLHQNFLELYEAPGAAENFHRKGMCVEYALIHRCTGDRVPFAP